MGDGNTDSGIDDGAGDGGAGGLGEDDGVDGDNGVIGSISRDLFRANVLYQRVITINTELNPRF